MAATLDMRTRTSRRPVRRVHWELPEVPEDSALGCGESEEDCSPCGGEEVRFLPGGKDAAETAKPLATIDEDGGLVAGSAAGAASAKAGAPRSLLRSLPTPARSRAAALQARAARGGPEPWNLPAASAPAEASGRTSSYRELLQLRGQQAMHRSLRTSAASRASPTAAAASPTAGVALANPAALLAAVPVQAPAPAPATPLFLAPAVAAAAAQQQAIAIPACSPQLPFFTVGGACQLGQLSPTSGQQSPSAAFGSRPECAMPLSRPEELMATLLPGARSLDKEQIAEQLAAAVPSCYDD